MKVHNLKTWPKYFVKVVRGEKNFEVRHNDRLFDVGDKIVLREWAAGDGVNDGYYTGKVAECLIQSVFRKIPGLHIGYVVLGTKLIDVYEQRKWEGENETM